MKASQTRIKNSIAEKGVTIDVGAGLPAKTDFQPPKMLHVPASSQASLLPQVCGEAIFQTTKSPTLEPGFFIPLRSD
jgi:hypothetical protein